MTVLLGALLVLEKVEKKANPNYKKPKAKLRERGPLCPAIKSRYAQCSHEHRNPSGKIGRASEFTKLSDADIKPEFSDDDDDDEDVGPGEGMTANGVCPWISSHYARRRMGG